MPDSARALHSLEVDLRANALRLVFEGETEAPQADREPQRELQVATLDIGTGGRLIGVELDEGYIDVMPPEPETEGLIRSSEARVQIERDATDNTMLELVIPRVGEGYEITYPSGNQ